MGETGDRAISLNAGRRVSSESVLFVTLDSCRYDTMLSADVPALKAVGPLRPAQAPSYFTYGSHSSMFVGFTPTATSDPTPLLNPKFAKLFKLRAAGFAGKGCEAFLLDGETVMSGFAAQGYATLGTGAVGWFDPDTPTGRHLTAPFERFFYAPGLGASRRQLDWIDAALDVERHRPVFLFANFGETHVPYWHPGADWDPADNPCQPFQIVDRRADCAARQRQCLEYLDRALGPLLRRFEGATILLCADHGDAWGEDGVWEHGVPHPTVLTVPMMMRVRGQVV